MDKTETMTQMTATLYVLKSQVQSYEVFAQRKQLRFIDVDQLNMIETMLEQQTGIAQLV